MEGMAKLRSEMEVILEAVGVGSMESRTQEGPHIRGQGGEEDLQRDCEGGMSRNRTEEYHGSQRKINPQEGEMSE